MTFAQQWFQEGMEEERQRWLQLGLQERILKMAKKMLSIGTPLERVVELSGLSVEEITQ